MRKILMIMVMLCCVSSAWALGGIKLVEIGVKAGVNSQSVDIVRPQYGNYGLSTDARMGTHIGIQSRINLLLFHIQPEIVYSMNRYRLMSVDGSGTLSKATVKLNTVEVPILIGMKFLFFRVNAGPVFNVLTNTNVAKQQIPARAVMISKPAISYMIGVGADVGKINFDVRYNGQLSRPDQSVQIGSQNSEEFKTKLRQWWFSVGYMF